METIDLINQTTTDHVEKTVSFKLPKDDFALLKAQCEQKGITVSDFLRKRLRENTEPTVLRQELRIEFELEKALDKLARSEDALAQAQQALALEREKRKKYKKRLNEAEGTIHQARADAEGGLSGLVTSHPAVGEILSNVLIRLAESPKIHQTIGALMGTSQSVSKLSEDDQALLSFTHELLERLSPDEFKALVQICHLLVAHRPSINSVLSHLRAVASKSPTGTVSSAPQKAPSTTGNTGIEP